MDTFSESLDVNALRVIDEKIAGAIKDTTPTIADPEFNRRGRGRLRRSKTVNVSSSFTSDAEIIEASPVNCEGMTSLREIRDKIQKNQSIRPVIQLTSLKRNKSDSLIRRSSGHHTRPQITEGDSMANGHSALLNESESMDLVRLKSILNRAEAATADQSSNSPAPPAVVITDTDKRILDQSEFSIIKTLGVKPKFD